MPDDIFIHPSSDVSPNAKIGRGTRIWQHCTVLAGAEIGEGCMLSANVFVEGRTKLGKHVKVKNNVSIYDLVELEDDVFIGPSAVFTNVLTPRSHWSRKDDFLRTLVRQGATIGANATVVCGTVIGRYAMIGAGSVVTGDVPDFALVYGVPARQHGWVCYCGERLVDTVAAQEVVCSHCGSRYTLTPAGLVDLELKPQAQHPEK